MKTEEKIQKLNLMEQSLNNFSQQKQNFQMQIIEIENALNELKNEKEAYKIIGNIMVKTEGGKLKEDLSSRKEIVDLRIKNIEKQEKKVKEDMEKLQGEVIKEIENEKK